MRVCPDCQASVSDAANFCDNCGYPIGAAQQNAPAAQQNAPAQPSPPPVAQAPAAPERGLGTGMLAGACAACGYVNLPGEMFCQNCGVQLAPVASLPPPPPRPVSGPLAPGLPGSEIAGSAPAASSALVQSAPAFEAAPVMRGRLLLRASRQSVPLPEGETEAVLGRSDPVKGVYPQVDLSPYGGDTSGVSRRHARLVAQDGQLYIEDLNSTNFTFLNRQKLTPGQLYPLNNGDELRLGLLVLELMT